MQKHEQKKFEWAKMALDVSDPKSQVGRPSDHDSFQDMVDDIKDKLFLLPGLGKFCDVGCGNGLVTSHLSFAFDKVYGADYVDEMVASAQKLYPEGEFVRSDATDLPFEDREFDRVLCYSIFHYFPSEAYAKKAISELVRITKPGGTLLVGDLLDKSFELSIKSGSRLDVERTRPLIHRYSEWLFLDLKKLAHYASNIAPVKSVEILSQPHSFKLSNYRKDVRICLH